MTLTAAITDWDDAYANRAYIPNAQALIDEWTVASEAFRQSSNAQLNIAYECEASSGDLGKRCCYDVFTPSSASKGLFVFVHGGYWLATSKETWSMFASGAVAAGYTVVMPSYPLCPAVSIATIQDCVQAAVEQAAREFSGPIVLTGHSAGGHLVTSLLCPRNRLSADVQKRLAHVVSISGVHDLRPLLNTTMNKDLGLDSTSAFEGSPAMQQPACVCPVTAWVGGDERPEFLRQNALLANVWRGLGAQTHEVVDPGLHHFNVIDGLRSAQSDFLQHTLSVLS